MFKSFTLAAFAAVASASYLQSYGDSRIPYSTSYSGPAKTSKWIQEYRPELIERQRYAQVERPQAAQYRSVNWGRGNSWRDIDPLAQQASQVRPSITNTLISPVGEVANAYDNYSLDSSNMAGFTRGMMARSAGVDYNEPVYKRTQNNGYRRDTLTQEYLHTDEPSNFNTYVDPKPWQLYNGYVDKRTVQAAGAGVAQVGYDLPLQYPTYQSKTVTYEKPVTQRYSQTKSRRGVPRTPEYTAPEYNFFEYDVKEPTKIYSTYYEAPVVYGEHTWGYLENERPDNRKNDWDIAYYGEDNGQYNPMAVLPRYPVRQVQTYDSNVIRKTQLQPNQYEQVAVEHDLVPAYEENVWTEPRYTDPRPQEQGYGTAVNSYRQAAEVYEPQYYVEEAPPTYRYEQTSYDRTAYPEYTYGYDDYGYDY